MSRLIRTLPTLALAAVGLAGCVGVPVANPPPPGAYAAPRGYGESPRAEPVAYGYTCSAGVYTCTLPAQAPLGSPCACPGLGAPSYGNVR